MAEGATKRARREFDYYADAGEEAYEPLALQRGGCEEEHIAQCPKKHPWRVRLAYNSSHALLRAYPWPQFVLGPVSVFHLTGSVGGVRREVYLLGDRHSKKADTVTSETECRGFKDGDRAMHVSMFLSEWLKRTDVFVDVFLEEKRFTTLTSGYPDCFLADVRHKFVLCTQPDKSLCYYDAARIHAIDWNLRAVNIPVFKNPSQLLGALVEHASSWGSSTLTLGIEKVVAGEDLASTFRGRKATILEDMEGAVRRVLESGILEAWSFVVDADTVAGEFMRLRKNWARLNAGVATQLLSIMLPFWASATYDYIIRYVVTLARLVHGRAGAGAEQWLHTEKATAFLKQLRREAQNVNVLYLAIFMDLYALARMFKQFSEEGDDRGPAHATNLIVYAGAAHIDTYVHVLSELGFVSDDGLKVEMQEEACVSTAPLDHWFFPGSRARAELTRTEVSALAELSGGARLGMLRSHGRVH